MLGSWNLVPGAAGCRRGAWAPVLQGVAVKCRSVGVGAWRLRYPKSLAILISAVAGVFFWSTKSSLGHQRPTNNRNCQQHLHPQQARRAAAEEPIGHL